MSSSLESLTAWVLESWTGALAQVCEAMAGVRPQFSFKLLDAAASAPEACLVPDALWFEQPLTLEGQAVILVGLPAAAWRELGGQVARASGLETTSDADLRSTFLELLGQSLGGLASTLGASLGREVRAEGGREILEPYRTGVCAELELTWEQTRLTGWRVGLSEDLLRALESARPEPAPASAPLALPTPAPAPPAPSEPPRTLDLLMEVELPVAVSFGRAELPLKEVLKLTTGSIIELNRTVEEPVELIVNNCVIARGDVVVVEGNYGVRIREIISPQERLRTLK